MNWTKQGVNMSKKLIFKWFKPKLTKMKSLTSWQEWKCKALATHCLRKVPGAKSGTMTKWSSRFRNECTTNGKASTKSSTSKYCPNDHAFKTSSRLKCKHTRSDFSASMRLLKSKMRPISRTEKSSKKNKRRLDKRTRPVSRFWRSKILSLKVYYLSQARHKQRFSRCFVKVLKAVLSLHCKLSIAPSATSISCKLAATNT